MSAVFWDWVGLLLRWAHVMLGILWIGTSFHFIWLDSSLRKETDQPEGTIGASWMVHGGGFYHALKYKVAPANLPRELHWFKYEAYFTWLSGFLLLGVVYYLGATEFLIDPSVLSLSPLAAVAISIAALAFGWIAYDALCRSSIGQNTALLTAAVYVLVVGAAYAFTQIFSGRAAFVHVGAFIGTIMAGNVFFIIIPNQKKTVAAMVAGEAPDPRLGLIAKQRSLHNNYLTLPVVLMMVSNHYPLLYAHANSWLYVAGVLLIGGLVRQFSNAKDSGETARYVNWLLPAAAVVLAALFISSFDFSAGGNAANAAPVHFAQVQPIIAQRCLACHSATPTDPAYKAPPKGIAFDKPEDVRRYAQQIYRMAVSTHVMPLGNKTGMLPEERDLVGRWIEGGAGG